MKKVILLIAFYLIAVSSSAQLQVDLEKLDSDSFPQLFYFADLKVDFIGKYTFDSTSQFYIDFEHIFLYKNSEISAKREEYNTNFSEIEVQIKTKKNHKILKRFKAKVSKIIFVKIVSNIYDDSFKVRDNFDAKSIFFKLKFHMPKNYRPNIYKPLVNFEVDYFVGDSNNLQKIQTYAGWYDTGYKTNRQVLILPRGINRYCFKSKFRAFREFKNYHVKFQYINNHPKCIEVRY